MKTSILARRVLAVVAATGLIAAGLSLWSGRNFAHQPDPGALKVKVLSNRADLISGGDALVDVELLGGAKAADVRVDIRVNGQVDRDVTGMFALRPNGRYQGLVTGLVNDDNILTARLPSGAGSRITINNHPNGGPVFSGPQIQPWPCLTGSTPPQCSRPVTYSYMYMSTTGSGFSAYNPASPPTDVKTTTTDQGKTVPYIIRIETGSQDRGQYQIAVLFDPTKTWEPWAPQIGWNGKTYTTGGSGCGTHHGETTAPAVTDDNALSRGFMVFSTALDHNTQNCNLVVQAESLMMAKERIVEAYGPIRYAIASGCSGGAIYQQQAANDYPGIFDGILPNCSFPDSWSTAVEVVDCRLLVDYFAAPTKWAPGVAWPPNMQAAVEGHPGPNICQSWINVYSFDQAANPALASGGLGLQSCNVPAAQANNPNTAFDPTINPKGIRCDLASYFVNELGKRPDGTANRPADNIGVQYGLAALKAGTITTMQFIDLNQQIGGRDNNYLPSPNRVVADQPSLAIAYRSGLFNQANNMHIPIIDIRGHDVEEIHHDYRSYVMRARLDKANGHHNNQVIWTGPAPLVGDAAFPKNALTVMDSWLAAIEADKSAIPLAEKVVKNKPAAAHDLCTNGDGTEIPNAAACAAANPYYQEPRMVAGEPFTGDILKCQLKPLSMADYAGAIPALTAAQFTALQALFPNGVCDYSKPGVDQQPTVPWLDYSAGPGGQPLPAEPVASQFAGVFNNHAPVAALTATPVSGTTPLTVNFDAGGSSDVDADALTYTFNFGDGSATVTQPGAKLSHSYTEGGSFAALLTVADEHGLAGGNVASVQINTTLPNPTAFTFIRRDGVPVSSFVTSESVTLTGFTGSRAISISNGQYSLNGGAFTNAAGQVQPGDKLVLRHVSAAADATQTESVVTVGTYSTSFISVTSTFDRVPDPFSFGLVNGQEPNKLVTSVAVTLTGFNTSIPVVAGPGAAYRINATGPFVSTTGTLKPGQSLQVQHTTNGAHLAYTKTYLKVGGVTGYFTTRTK